MRWKLKPKILLEIGDTRIKNRFLFFPKTIKLERRWLERATWQQVIVRLTSESFPGFYLGWADEKWIEVHECHNTWFTR